MCAMTSAIRSRLHSSRTRRIRALPALPCVVACALLACDGVSPSRDAAVTDAPVKPATPRLDLLLVVDNSGSMTRNIDRLSASLDGFYDALAAPLPDGRALRDVHIGVVSTDLGSPGRTLVDCEDGDDGRLNPLAHGARPRPGRDSRCEVRPTRDILRADLASERRADLLFELRCQLAMAVFGCGIEQPLEAARRALARRPSDDAGPFLRDDAVLAVVVLSDEEDGSVRDCRDADAGACDDARDVFDPSSTRWRTSDANLRFYDYTPCGPQDPTWPLDRYAHPTNPALGFTALKPGHPERVVFAAITGIPLHDPRAPIAWSSLLGVASPRGADDYCGRDARELAWTAADGTPTSMRPANLDPSCPGRVVPACYAEGTSVGAMCLTTDRYFAWPGRRVVEVARRFDESPRCGGAPCGNGYVASICADDFSPAMAAIARRIRRRL